MDGKFLYVNSAFAPAPDEIVENLHKVRFFLLFVPFFSSPLTSIHGRRGNRSASRTRRATSSLTIVPCLPGAEIPGSRLSFGLGRIHHRQWTSGSAAFPKEYSFDDRSLGSEMLKDCGVAHLFWILNGTTSRCYL